LNPGTRLTTEYLFRLRPDPAGGWFQDHIAVLTLFFAPDIGNVTGRGLAGGD
jgi:hypothetical protein